MKSLFAIPIYLRTEQDYCKDEKKQKEQLKKAAHSFEANGVRS